MTLGPDLPTPLDVAGRAVVHHPDQRSGWIIVVAATLPAAPDTARLHDGVPLAGARLVDGSWVAGAPNPVLQVDGDPLAAEELWRPLPLGSAAPLRIVVAGRRVALAGHHAAFDGLALLALVRLLAGADPAQPSRDAVGGGTRPRTASGSGGTLGRLLHPADRVAPSVPAPTGEARAWRPVELGGGGVTARLAAAATRAVALHNRDAGLPLRRVGISVGVGGRPGIGNHASYRRVDVDLARDHDVAGAVEAALAESTTPPELRRAPRAFRLLAPVVRRVGDTLLVSNLGPTADDGLQDTVFFPVARGRSAVAFGAVASTLSVRARDLSRPDAEALLEATVAALT